MLYSPNVRNSRFSIKFKFLRFFVYKEVSMDSLQEMAPQLATLFGPDVLRVLVAIIVLFVGWLVARIGAWAVKKSLEKTTIDNRIAKWVLGDQKGEGFEVEVWVGKVVYYILLLFALVLFFNTLKLTVVSEPLLTPLE